MLWCRERFRKLDSVLEHLLACYWLSDTWYWCSGCSRPESYLGCKSSNGAGFTLRSIQRKNSILRRAATFFRHFGRMNPAKGGFLWPEPPNGTYEMADTASKVAELNGAKRRHEIACYLDVHHTQTDIDLPTKFSHTVRHELPLSTEKVSTELPSYAEIPMHRGHVSQDNDIYRAKESVHELSDFAMDPIHELPDLERDPIHVLSGFEWLYPRHGPPGGLLDHESPGDMHDDVRGKPLQGIDILVHNDCAHAHTFRTSLRDPAPDPLSSPMRSVDIENHESLEETFPQYRQHITRPTQVRPIPRGWFPQDHCERWRAMIKPGPRTNGIRSAKSHPSPSDHRFEQWLSRIGLGEVPFLYGDLTPMQQSVRDLCEIVTIVHHEWLKQLSLTPEALAVLSGVSSRSLCRIGLEALQKAFGGIFEFSLLEVVALLNVASAASYMLHRDDKSHCWWSFTLSMAQWRHTVSQESDARLFVMVLEKVTALSYTNKLTSQPIHDDISNSLKHGQAMRDFSNFLDGEITSLLIAPNLR